LNVALIRHPAPLVGAGICYGRLDLPLHPDGITAIQAIVDQLADFAGRTVWSSPARRCLALAEAITNCTSPLPRQDARLLELDFGKWEGKPWDSVPRDGLDRWAADPLSFAPPGGESGAALIARVRSFYQLLMAEGENCVVVSHGGPLKVLAALLQCRKVDLLASAPAFGWVDVVSC
jgi:alpha-ribazole phosphatase